VTLPSMEFCAAPKPCEVAPQKLSRQKVASTAMCGFAWNRPAVSVIPELIRTEVSACCLPDARAVKDIFSGLVLVLGRSFLSQMVIVLDYREAGVVEIVRGFQACHADKRKF
jgi:hypothetical protein